MALGSIAGITFVGDPRYPCASVGTRPIQGQAVQVFSGIVSLGGDRFLALNDNAFGSKLISQDALLRVHHVEADWAGGLVTPERTTFLRVPQRQIPFAIQNEATAERFLTGVDHDLNGRPPNDPNDAGG